VTQRSLTNVSASVRQRLLNEARSSGESYEQVLQYFAIERFLFRLSQTEWSDRLIVKGAIMLRAWGTPLGRPTRDIDFLGTIGNTEEAVVAVIRDCLSVSCPEDGLAFESVVDAEEIKVAERYPGVRAIIRGHLDGGVFRVQLDIGIDDVVVPGPDWVDYPTLIGFESPRVLAYQPVTALAEKFETIVSRGLANSRLRDYYDLWLLPTLHSYKGADVSAAIGATFSHRGTGIPASTPVGLTAGYFDMPESRQRWTTFLSTRNIDAPSDLAVVCSEIAAFIIPPSRAASADEGFTATWDPLSGWSE